MSALVTRPTRNRRPGRYQLSPYDKVSQGAKAKFKASPLYVNNQLYLDQLKLIQYAFNKDGNRSEIIVSTDDQFISRHNFMSLLPNTALSEEICGQSALTVGADVDGFAQAVTVGKPFMPDFRSYILLIPYFILSYLEMPSHQHGSFGSLSGLARAIASVQKANTYIMGTKALEKSRKKPKKITAYMLSLLDGNNQPEVDKPLEVGYLLDMSLYNKWLATFIIVG
ncbi:hypothetical protein WN944_023795 [Citrus x changshan-huyou]|uniref:Uncharacterized protein n=1 Tax=Citrus x changshan-huyou TaxID=2935761 RepID=A0AAP0LMA3_9ROSI